MGTGVPLLKQQGTRNKEQGTWNKEQGETNKEEEIYIIMNTEPYLAAQYSDCA